VAAPAQEDLRALLRHGAVAGQHSADAVDFEGSGYSLVFACGTVIAQPDGWHGQNTITRDDGRTVVIDRKWLIKESAD